MGKMRVAVLSTHDWANSGWKISQALESVGVESKCFTQKVCHFYPNRKLMVKELEVYLRCCTAILFKGDEGVINPFYGVNVLELDKPLFCAFGGSSFLRGNGAIISKHEDIRQVKGLIALRPDLRFKDMFYLPHPVDMDLWKPVPKKDGRTLIVGHYISNKGQMNLKGTAIIKKAIEANSKYMTMDFCMNMPYEEIQMRKKKCDIYIESIGFRYYGNNGAESMALGIPTIAEIPGFVFDMNPGLNVTGILNCNAKNLATKLMKLTDLPSRLEWKKRSYEYALNTHSYKAVGNRLKKYILERIG